MVDSEFPRPTGRKPAEVSLTGKVIPWEKGVPVMLRMDGSPYLWVPCFSSATSLRVFLNRIGVTHDGIKQVDEQWEFLESFPRKDGEQEIRFMLDPYHTEEGKVRFAQLIFD